MWHVKRTTSRVALSVSLIAVVVALWTAGCGSKAAASRSPGTASTVGAALTVPAPSAPAPTHSRTRATTRARAALSAFDRAFYVAFGFQAHHATTTTTGGRADFWRQAELIEMEEDAYQNTGDPATKKKIVALMRGVVSLHGRNWAKHTWNDDIMWMVIASARAYELTGDTAYRIMAQRNFDATYARSWSKDFGGGLWWTTAHTQKNVTTTEPAAIAACKLATALHDPSYLTKAKRLFGWVRRTLYDAKSGAVWDSISPAKGGTAVVNRAGLTYNQGTFIGAADLLHQVTHDRTYYEDALRTLGYTKANLTTNGILQSESSGHNGNFGGFKGIFCRWAVKFVRDNHISSYDLWFQQNAAVAWRHRNASGLMAQDWSAQTGSGVLQAWGCSSAVVLLEAISGS